MKSKTGRKVVILIDEYDKAIISNLSKGPAAEEDKNYDTAVANQYFLKIFYLTAELLADVDLKIDSELLTASGRIDMVVESENEIYIIEFKVDQSSKKAIAQIKEKKYAARYKLKNKTIFLLGINFNTDQKNVEEYMIEKV
jgi:ATP-dependent exoDNAse (exonuclease V) beta subunit